MVNLSDSRKMDVLTKNSPEIAIHQDRRDEPIYLDYQATTPIDPRVVSAMEPHISGAFGNPHSVHHSIGSLAGDAVEMSRGQIADLINCDPGEIVFTSGATEANNLAILGIREFLSSGRDHVVTVATEHKCVLAAASELEKLGFKVDMLPVDRDGMLDLDHFESKVTDRTALVSVMFANNEIGVIQPIRQIGEIAHRHGALFHSDGAQAVGKVSIDVDELGLDLLSISAHKFYGPKGIGALFIRQPLANKLQPIIFGGGQELGIRSGSLPTMLCVGLGHACQIASEEMPHNEETTRQLRDAFLSIVRKKSPDLRINGHMESRLAGNLNLCFPNVPAEGLLGKLHYKIAASTGSACTSGFIEPSHVLLALGLSVEDVHCSIRFGFGVGLSLKQVKAAANIVGSDAGNF